MLAGFPKPDFALGHGLSRDHSAKCASRQARMPVLLGVSVYQVATIVDMHYSRESEARLT